MKKVVLLTTGGTIASVADKETGLLTPGVLTGEQLTSMYNLNIDIEVIVESVFQIPSSHMTFQKLIALKNKINIVIEDYTIDGIVITHGTDTLEETAYFLDLTLSDDRPIVVTGAQRGPLELGTDAFVNIRQAILVASNKESLRMGVTVLFNGKIFSAKYVRKVHTSNLDAFHSYGFGFLGMVDRDNVYIYQKPIRREYYEINKVPPKVVVIKAVLGLEQDMIDYTAKIGAKGMIIEGLGRGHVSPQAALAIAEAVTQGVTVVITTGCEEGEVSTVYHFSGSVHDLKEKGVILGKDYGSKKARIKLAVLLAAEVENIQEQFLL